MFKEQQDEALTAPSASKMSFGPRAVAFNDTDRIGLLNWKVTAGVYAKAAGFVINLIMRDRERGIGGGGGGGVESTPMRLQSRPTGFRLSQQALSLSCSASS